MLRIQVIAQPFRLILTQQTQLSSLRAKDEEHRKNTLVIFVTLTNFFKKVNLINVTQMTQYEAVFLLRKL